MRGMLKENSLKDKVILVTGGGSGLGKSMVEYFLELGAVSYTHLTLPTKA